MKFTLSWLTDHLATKAGLDEILALMLKAGLEVEEVIDPAAKLAPFTVCKVIEAAPHPDRWGSSPVSQAVTSCACARWKPLTA